MARRKSWDELTPDYRARLERKGVNRAKHESGKGSHAKARGHKSRPHERKQSREYREVNSWIADYAGMYGKDPDDVREALAEFPKTQVVAGIHHQLKMQELYHSGRFKQARALWDKRDRSLPDWMNFYHGYFS